MIFLETQKLRLNFRKKRNDVDDEFENGFDGEELVVDENRLETLSNYVQIIFPYSILTSICQNYENILEIDFKSIN